MDDLKGQVHSSEALVADLQKTLQPSDPELESLGSKVCYSESLTLIQWNLYMRDTSGQSNLPVIIYMPLIRRLLTILHSYVAKNDAHMQTCICH